ncbi:hypothetical protein JCM16303_002822 [Sporobolomyces ruberrimus]
MSPSRTDSPLELPGTHGSPVPPSFAAHLAQFAHSPSSSTRSKSPSKPPPLHKSPTPVPHRRVRATPERKPSLPRKRSRSQSCAPISPHFAQRDQDSASPPSPPPTSAQKKGKKAKKPARKYADPSQYAELGEHPLMDYLKEDLDVLLCGINPGVKSAQMGQHYASPTNHFWKALAGSGLTDRRLDPSEGSILPDQYCIGSTNLVPRPSAEMSELSIEEMRACVPALLRKIVTNRPKIVAFVGMKICEIVFRHLHMLPTPSTSCESSLSPNKKKRKPAMPKIKLGLQPVMISLPARIGTEGVENEERRRILFWCLPSTSARVVTYQLVDKIRIFGELKIGIESLKANNLELPPDVVEYQSEHLFLDTDRAVDGGVKMEPIVEESKPWNVTLIEKADSEVIGYNDGTGEGVTALLGGEEQENGINESVALEVKDEN